MLPDAPSHVTGYTITCYRMLHHMLPDAPSYVTGCSITCYQNNAEAQSGKMLNLLPEQWKNIDTLVFDAGYENFKLVNNPLTVNSNMHFGSGLGVLPELQGIKALLIVENIINFPQVRISYQTTCMLIKYPSLTCISSSTMATYLEILHTWKYS